MAGRSCLGIVLSAVLAVIAQGSGAFAQAPGAPADWPCPQQYIPELSLAQVWRGATPDQVAGHWAADPQVAPWVPRLAAADLPLEELEAEVDRFAAGLAPEERERRLSLLFFGAFELLNAERRRAVEGALRFTRRQHELAARIREESDRLLQLDRNGDATGEAAELRERLQWDLRLFEERRSATAAVCEQPDLIEKRIFALARVIHERIGKGGGR
jgi:hypothetical protein